MELYQKWTVWNSLS